jgi:parallel beta-helix repeat protein
VHKLALPITPGQWYFDYSSDVIYIADNPAGHTMELSVAQQAFSGYVYNVTVQNLTVEKYATPLMAGAIGPYGDNWIIKSNEVRLNHGAGIKAQYGSADYEQILSNNVHDNGQQGLAVGGGKGSLIEYNTLTGNNFARVKSESGGGKIAGTTNVQVINNTYSNNYGPGLWLDCDATGSILSGNTITGNEGDGIRSELGHYGTFTNNTLKNNAQNPVTKVCTGNAREIAIADSDHTMVSGNTINSNCAGITMTQGTRNLSVNNSVVHNTITYPGVTQIRNPFGGVDSQTPTTLFDPDNHNYFDYNTYHFSSPTLPTLKHWKWNGTGLNWSGWQAADQDVNGTVD